MPYCDARLGRRALRKAILVLLLVMLGGLGTAQAQDQKVNVSLGGGPAWTLGDLGESFGTGANFELGVDVRMNERFGLRFDYLFGRFREGADVSTDVTIPEVDPLTAHLDATHRVHSGTVNAVFTSSSARRGQFYVLGGVAFFVEGRYHFVWGPEIEQEVTIQPVPGVPSQKANGTYFPLTFGFRFGG